MQNKSYQLFIIILLISTSSLFSQSVDEILQKTKKVYSNDIELSMNMSFNLYQNEGSTISESFQAEYLKLHNDYYTKINKTETLIKEGLYIKINHDQGLIQVDQSEKGMGDNSMFKNFDVESFSSFTKTKELKNTKNSFIVTLNLNPKNIYQFSKVVIIINKKTYRITKQLFYFRDQYFSQFNNGIKSNARLEIIYSEFKNKIIPSKRNLLKESYYIIRENGITKPAKRFENYTIVAS